MKTIPLTQTLVVILLLVVSTLQSNALSFVSPLTKEEAPKVGVTVKSKSNGQARTKVWLEIKKNGPLGDFAAIELQMKDGEGKHLLSTMLQPNPVAYNQSDDIVTVSFSVKPSQLNACSFWIFKGGLGSEILTIKVSDFLNAQKEPSR